MTKKRDSKKSAPARGRQPLWRRNAGKPHAEESKVYLRLTELEVTYEPMPDEYYDRLPEEVKAAIVRLHEEIKTQPGQAIPELLGLLKRYPDYPKFYNLLFIAYSVADQQDKAEEMAIENYRRNPEYLFARLNFASLCLAWGDIEQIPEIFDNKFDLTLLYPGRKVFHVTEVISFMAIMANYFHLKGEPETAESYYSVVEQLAPDHPTTRQMDRILHPPGFPRRKTA